ncbi:serine/threonine-protein kinase [Scytonema millei]|uniref:Protein kinase n=1 Tax=Scytonema millei VB511283 TaxID=1245923 RepID=A0A9X5E5N7_9CYAN|nr:serine/threonine-protein kinase [Scytonema millei]NHC35421.1 protein kinase [Scytonema millei VB511283]
MTFPAQPETWIGRSIGDRQRYRLERRLGSGGMGDVFLAMDTLLGQHVALKLLKEKLAASKSLRKRFEREVAICAALKSDHIVNVSDYGVTDEGHPFYVMEYLRGDSLKQLLKQQQRLPVERTIKIVTQACEGLRLAHSGIDLWWSGATASEHVKVVHRDLKPDNIFVVPTALGELVKILDFGIAKIRDESIDRTNLTYGFIGTFRYAAPEQLRAANTIDARADIYSLGVILYELLSGTDPFGFGAQAYSITGMGWAMAHKTKPPIPIRLQPGCENLSPQLEAAVMQCLQKSPSDRFASVEQLKQVLKATITHKPEEAIDNSLHSSPSAPTHPQPSVPVTPEAATTKAYIPPPPTKTEAIPPTSLPNTLSPPNRQEVRASAQFSAPQHSNPAHSSTDDSILIPPPARQRRLSTSTLFFVGAAIGVGIVALGAVVYSYIQFRLTAQVIDEIQTLKHQARYEACASRAETVTRDSTVYAEAQAILNECHLEHAKQLAGSSNFAEAIAIAKQIPQDSPLYSQAQILIQDWSEI